MYRWCLVFNTIALAMLVIFLSSLLLLLPQADLRDAKEETPDQTQNTRFETVIIANATLLTLVLTLTLAKLFSYLGDSFVQLCVVVCKASASVDPGNAFYQKVQQYNTTQDSATHFMH